MKKLLFLLPLLFLLTFPQFQYADTASSDSATASPTAVTVDYTMPFPGLLPDNPLYALKVLRDKFISFFISDSLKRSSFDELQSDKRLEGAYYLQRKGEKYDDLVGATISKAGNYSDSAIQAVKQARSMGEETSAQEGTLHTALVKHQQIISQMMQGASKTLQKNLQHEVGRLKNLDKMLKGLSKE